MKGPRTLRPAAGRTHLLVVASFTALLGNQPCGPIPGDALEGSVHTEPVTDWSFSDAHSRCVLEVRPEDPHSVTTSCFADGDVIYVPAIMGDSKRWTKWATADPSARLRIGDTIYPVTIERIEDERERVHAAKTGYRKYQEEEPEPGWEPSEDRWYFRLRSRVLPASEVRGEGG